MDENKTMHKDIGLFEIFTTFLRIGLFTFGGGLAMLNVIRHELLDKKKWIDNDEFLNLIIVSTSIPGLIAANCAYQLGYRLRKSMGAFFAVLGVILPSFFIILIIVSQFSKSLSGTTAQAFLRGSSAAVLAQIAYSTMIFGRDVVMDIYSMLVVALGLSLLLFLSLHPVLIILICMLLRYVLPVKRRDQF